MFGAFQLTKNVLIFSLKVEYSQLCKPGTAVLVHSGWEGSHHAGQLGRSSFSLCTLSARDGLHLA